MVKIWEQIGDYMGDHVGNLEHIIQATYDSTQLDEYIGTYGIFPCISIPMNKPMISWFPYP